MTRTARVVVGISMLLCSAPATAQTEPAPAATAFTAGWNDGFVLQSATGNERLVVGLAAQVDGRFAFDDVQRRVGDTFLVRKMRPTFTGRVSRYFDFKVMPDFGNGTVVLTDAYLDVRFSAAFRVRAGKDKTPVGYEVLIGDSFLPFPERSLTSSLLPNRDVGFQAQGDLAAGRISYAAGVFNGIPDGSSATEIDANGGKDVAARIVVHPFGSPRGPVSALNGLGFALGGSAGNEEGELPAFRTSAGQAYFSYATGSTASGDRSRVTPAVFYYHKAFGGFAEWARSRQEVARSDLLHNVTNESWNVTGSFVVTGEAASDRGVRPRNNFDPMAGAWGALQLLARYAALSVDDAAFRSGLAATGASRAAKSFTLGVNWYPSGYIKYYATFERTVFDDDADGLRQAENAAIFRVQLAF
jgi:phosphate-selective porin OprO and OprP